MAEAYARQCYQAISEAARRWAIAMLPVILEYVDHARRSAVERQFDSVADAVTVRDRLAASLVVRVAKSPQTSYVITVG